MKKITLISLVFFALAMSACQGTGAQENQEKTKTTDQVSQENGGEKAAIQLDEETFREKVVDYKNDTAWNFKGDKPCLVDFYADWCAPCRITSPILEDMAKKYQGEIHVYKVDVDKNRQLAAAFGVRGIPSFLYCPADGEPTMSSGIGGSREETREMFRQNIEKYLLKN
ncbi:MAG TPA: thioredoxin domain-containing protein [Bacteroidales bacterium]|nr:thioredoxin domain-containing protein [Bacteroidales bacterium]